MEQNAYEYTTFPRRFVTYKWFKPLIVGLITVLFAFLCQMMSLALAGLWLGDYNLIREATERSSEHFFTGPGAFLAIGGVASLLPSLAIASRIVGDRPFSSYSSSRGGWNWGAFAKCLVLAAIVFGGAIVTDALLLPDPAADHVNRFTMIGLLVCLIAVPIQATAEEYIYRGLIMQAVGSWTNIPLVAMLISSVLFAISHSYGVFGIAAVLVNGLGFAFLTRYSKGLEASSSAHIANNLAVFLCNGVGLASSNESGLEGLIATTAMMTIYCVATVLLDKKYGWFTPQGNGVTAFNEKHRAKAEK